MTRIPRPKDAMYRQGDVLLVAVVDRPRHAQKQTGCVLAEGEVTGHRHEVLTDALLWIDTDGIKYLEVCAPEARVIHPEHGPLTLAGPAMYRVIHQREYTPKAIRRVQD